MTYSHTLHVSNASLRASDFAHFKAMQRGSEKLRLAVVRAMPKPIKPVNNPRPQVPVAKVPMPDTVRAIVEQIAHDMDVLPEDIWGKSRANEKMAARLVAYAVLTHRCGSMAQVGRWLGRDHTTVRSGLLGFDKVATPWMRQLVERYTREQAA